MLVQFGGHDSAFLPECLVLHLIITVSSAQCRALLLRMKSRTVGVMKTVIVSEKCNANVMRYYVNCPLFSQPFE